MKKGKINGTHNPKQSSAENYKRLSNNNKKRQRTADKKLEAREKEDKRKKTFFELTDGPLTQSFSKLPTTSTMENNDISVYQCKTTLKLSGANTDEQHSSSSTRESKIYTSTKDTGGLTDYYYTGSGDQ